MERMRRVFVIIICLAIVMMGAKSQTNLANSAQLLWVGVNTSSIHGQLQCYQRETLLWKKVGVPIPVVIGKKGVTARKREGDGKTPLGIFPLGPLFGFNQPINRKFPYLLLKDSTVCVDDIHSRYYNRIVNRRLISDIDWHSSEKMRSISLYRFGAVIQFNKRQKPNAGSCIFLHIQNNSNEGTAGCVAMSPENLKKILLWLDPEKNPMIRIADY
jgi:L,D-peptidoglycan transpeptidase YkuD (ErfK/YbiS/YcfS/YnhG family)